MATLIIKYSFRLALLILLCEHGYGQNASVDSLKRLLNKSTGDKEKIKFTLELSTILTSSEPFAALEYSSESIEMADRLGSDSLKAAAQLGQAATYLQLGNYPKATQLYYAVMNAAEKSGDSNMLFTASANLGNVHYYQGNHEEALKNYLGALSYFKSGDLNSDTKKAKRKALLLSNIGVMYDETKKYDSAAIYYEESLLLSTRLNDHEAISNVLNNKGTLFRDRGNNDSAYKYYLAAMELREKHDNKPGMARSYNNIGEFYFKQLKDYDKAGDYFRKAITLGKEIGMLQTVSSSSSLLYNLYKEQGLYKDALEALELHREISDSIFNEASTKKIAQLEMQFEFDQRQHELKLKQREKELYYWMGGATLILLLIIVTLLFFLQRNKTRKSKLEQANLQIAKLNLEKDIDLKDKELATNIIYLLNKNELINSISEKLLEIKQNASPETQSAVQKIVIELQSNLQPELWQEFEVRFQQVHEDFHKILNEKFPDLSPSERRLCTFLKLNMSTKEISAITHQNAKSIDVARTRLRKKLNLTGTDHNLVTFLGQLGNPR